MSREGSPGQQAWERLLAAAGGLVRGIGDARVREGVQHHLALVGAHEVGVDFVGGPAPGWTAPTAGDATGVAAMRDYGAARALREVIKNTPPSDLRAEMEQALAGLEPGPALPSPPPGGG